MKKLFALVLFGFCTNLLAQIDPRDLVPGVRGLAQSSQKGWVDHINNAKQFCPSIANRFEGLKGLVTEVDATKLARNATQIAALKARLNAVHNALKPYESQRTLTEEQKCWILYRAYISELLIRLEK